VRRPQPTRASAYLASRFSREAPKLRKATVANSSLDNQPVASIGLNHFAISWITSTGSVFHTSGALTDGYVVIQPQ